MQDCAWFSGDELTILNMLQMVAALPSAEMAAAVA